MDQNTLPSLEELMHSPQAAELLRQKEALLGLTNSPEAQTLIRLLNQNGGAALKGAAESAMRGDLSQLTAVLNRISQDPEGARAMDGIRKTFPGTGK